MGAKRNGGGVLDRKQLKEELWAQRPRICDVCGRPMRTCDMHESIVRRGVAQGWKRRDRPGIFVPCNCNLVHHVSCHRLAHALSVLMVAIQIVRYGKPAIQAWIDSLPFKVEYRWDRGLSTADAIEMVEQGAPWITEEEPNGY